MLTAIRSNSCTIGFYAYWPNSNSHNSFFMHVNRIRNSHKNSFSYACWLNCGIHTHNSFSCMLTELWNFQFTHNSFSHAYWPNEFPIHTIASLMHVNWIGGIRTIASFSCILTKFRSNSHNRRVLMHIETEMNFSNSYNSFLWCMLTEFRIYTIGSFMHIETEWISNSYNSFLWCMLTEFEFTEEWIAFLMHVITELEFVQ